MKQRTSKNHTLFCPEHYTEIENYELAKADNFVGWICHHRNGEHHSVDWLKEHDMYYNREDPSEFKFVTVSEHCSINHYDSKALNGERNGMYGKHHSEEAKQKMRDNHCKVTWGSYGFKNNHHTDEYKAHMSEVMTGRHHSEEAKQKMRDAWVRRRQAKESKCQTLVQI